MTLVNRARLFLILMIVSSARCGSQTEMPAHEAVRIVDLYYRGVSTRDYWSVASLFQYPDEEASELAADKASVRRGVEVFVRRFGDIAVHRRGDLPAVIEVGVGSGTIPYWSRYPDVLHLTYLVTFSRWNSGRVVFDFARVAGGLRLRQVRYGLPINDVRAHARIAIVAADLVRAVAQESSH